MYTLRTMTAENKQTNLAIGNVYSIICRDSNYDEFADTFLLIFGLKHVADMDEGSVEITKSCHGFVQIKGDCIPLYKKNKYYIMTESGKTFSNLSY